MMLLLALSYSLTLSVGADSYPRQIWQEGAATSPKRVLIVSIDNRPFSWDPKDSHYPTLTSIITRDYAVYQQYDYLYIMNEVKDLVPRVKAKYHSAQEDPMMKTEQVEKDIATGFNVNLKQYRAASWAKLPALWRVTKHFLGRYDYIWYIDSDATVNPMHFNQSIADKVSYWKKNGFVKRGQKDLDKAVFIFFNNFPWRDDMPCAGSFLFRPTSLSEQIFRQWWDFDLPVKNFKHFHEQDALWHMLEHPEYGFLISGGGSNKDNQEVLYSVVKEQQFPSGHTRYEDLWLVHIASYNYALRNPVLFQFLRLLKRHTSHTTDPYIDAVDMLLAYHVYAIDPLLIAEQMEARNNLTSRIMKWPAHDVDKQNEWYDMNVVSRTIPPLSLSSLFEGRLVRFKREFFLVQGGKKRPFGSYEAYLQLKLPEECAHSLSRHEHNNIPTGDVIVEMLMTEVKNELIRYYMPLTLPNMHNNTYYHIETEFQHAKHTKKHSHSSPLSFSTTATPSSSHPASAPPCVTDSELLHLMSTSNTNLYIMSHGGDSLAIAKHFAYCKEKYMKVLTLSSSLFFESIVYQNLLPGLLNAPNAPQYVILSTYKTVGKSLQYNGYTQSLTQMRVYLRHFLTSQYDIVPFLRSGSAHLPFALYFHGPPYKMALYQLLLAMGYSQSVIEGFDNNMHIFFRNIYVAKREFVLELCQFMAKAIDVAINNAKVKELLAKDAKYKEGEESVARKVFGTDYYQLHPFVFERLPAFFVYAHNKTICQQKTGICRYNS